MHTVAVFFDKPGFDEYPFSIELYRTVYRQLGEKLEKLGAQLCIVRGQESFVRGNTFTHAWKFDGTWFQYVDEPTTVDLIWNKGFFRSDPDTRVINDPELDAIATDKWKSYEMFPTHHARTRMVQTEADWHTVFADFPEALLVIKPLEGWGGEGVRIGMRSVLEKEAPLVPSIVQEFIDTSGGVPGLVEGMHDLRVLFLGDAISLCYIRTPPQGGMKANISGGGQLVEVPKERLPEGAVKVALDVDAKLARFARRIYTIDMGRRTDGEWKIFELNAKPGFQPMEMGKTYAEFYDRLAEFLVQASQKNA